jgi:hypothetical protein
MFRTLAGQVQTQLPPGPTAAQTAAERVLELPPMQLSRYLEEVWAARPQPLLAPRGLEVPGVLVGQERTSGVLPTGVAPPVTAWRHLIYAYMIENTRVYDIFTRVLRQYVYGEQLGIPDEASARWLRTTEALFYSQSPPFQIYSLTSLIRPDAGAVRRNAYYRLFGMDLNHGTDEGGSYAYEKPRAANREFVATFEELLREVWRGVENAQNLAGANPTDDATIQNLTQTLFEMLETRRLNGNLRREELFYTSMMEWFHLTLSFDTPIVKALKADASAPDERLAKIAVKVGLPSHSRSHSYFEIADPISTLLRFVEAGAFNGTGAASALYTQTNWRRVMTDIVSHWSLATGRDMKARKVAVSASSPSSTRPAPVAASGNGTRVPARTP